MAAAASNVHALHLHRGGLVQRNFVVTARAEGGHVVQRTITAVSTHDAADAMDAICTAQGLVVRGMSTRCIGVASPVGMRAFEWADTEAPSDDPEITALQTAVPAPSVTGPSALDEIAAILASTLSTATHSQPGTWPSADLSPIVTPSLRPRDWAALAMAAALSVGALLAWAGMLS